MLSPGLTLPPLLFSSPGNIAPLASRDDVFQGVHLPLQSSTACEYQQLLCFSSCPGLSGRRAMGMWHHRGTGFVPTLCGEPSTALSSMAVPFQGTQVVEG